MPAMSAAALDRLLAILLAAQLATGLLSLRAGSPPTAPLFVVHGLLAGALLAAVALKLYRSVPSAIAARRWPALALASVLALAASAALAGGFLWVASGRILVLGQWTVLTLHVWAALALVPILVVHLLPRRWRLLRPTGRRAGGLAISRRTALGTLGLATIGVAAWLGGNLVESLSGGVRRFTGSRWLPDGLVPPVTTFFGEGAPNLDPDAWRLRVDGAVYLPLDLSLSELTAIGEVERQEVLDCTSGWAQRSLWRGVPLDRVLAAARPTSRARHVTVRSATGWYARMPIDEAPRAMLATGVAGGSLPVGNGAPCRLVAPDRRGLEWVKWVTRVEVS
jgi:DMSO/TMAO reductase YedYZ molybdopterin-dependent catalytic subunit